MPTEQTSLFGPPDAYGGITPLAHRGDPLTSHQAAARAAKGGKVMRHREIALRLVKAMPKSTAHELWAGASEEDRREMVNVFELYRRLADLKNAHVIQQGEARKCAVRGVKMVPWLPAETP